MASRAVEELRASNPVLHAMAESYADALNRLAEMPIGQTILAGLLRRAGWTCTPPAAAPTTRRAARRKAGRK